VRGYGKMPIENSSPIIESRQCVVIHFRYAQEEKGRSQEKESGENYEKAQGRKNKEDSEEEGR